VIEVDERGTLDAIASLPLDGEGGIAFCDVDWFGIPIPCQRCCQTILSIQDPGIPCLRREQDKLPDCDDSSRVCGCAPLNVAYLIGETEVLALNHALARSTLDGSAGGCAVDKIYAAVQNGPRGKRVRQANLSIDIARRAWKIVRRLYPNVVPAENPFEGVLKISSSGTKVAATRAEAYALANALKEIGEPHLGAAALICFEWLQRPENVLTGRITWPDYRPPEHPNHVRIFHHKTGQVVLQPLEAEGRKLYPELETYLSDLPRIGVPIVVTKGSRGPSRPYAMVYAQAKVREARESADLGSHVTLDACRHGGMTELGDAELAEQGVMALSGHKTPQAARLYVKRTERQRITAAAKRRQWVEANETETRVEMEGRTESRNGTKGSD
jgi:integrase